MQTDFSGEENKYLKLIVHIYIFLIFKPLSRQNEKISSQQLEAHMALKEKLIRGCKQRIGFDSDIHGE